MLQLLSVLVDVDDDIDNTKPAATQPNVVHFVGDGMVNSTPLATLTNVSHAPVTLSLNNDFDVSHKSSPSQQYRSLDNTSQSTSENVLIHYHTTCDSSPKISLENNIDLLSSDQKYHLTWLQEKNHRRGSKKGFSLTDDTLLIELRKDKDCNKPKCLSNQTKQCYRHFETETRKTGNSKTKCWRGKQLICDAMILPVSIENKLTQRDCQQLF